MRSSCGPCGRGPGEITIEVVDEGCGVRPEALGRIFDRFAPRRCGAHALGRRRRTGAGHRRRDRQTPRWALHRQEHRAWLDVRTPTARLHAGWPASDRAQPTAETRRAPWRSADGSQPAAGAQPFEHLSVDPAGVPGAGDDQRGRGDDPAPNTGLEVAPDSRLGLRPAPVGVEALEVELERARSLPQVGILEPALVGEQQVVHLPEALLPRRRLGRARRRPGARVARADREMAERDAQPARRRACPASAAQYGHSKSP